MLYSNHGTQRNHIAHIEHTLYVKIIDFLTSIPDIHDSNSQRALIYRTGLDPQLQDKILFGQSSAKFVSLLVTQLINYGRLQDGRNALEAVLETSKNYVGHDQKEECEFLIQELHTLNKYNRYPIPTSSPPLVKSWDDILSAIEELDKRLQKENFEFECIVSFSGGGLVIADLLHILHRPKVPVIACVIQRYPAKLGRLRKMKVKSPGKSFLKNISRILLLDDVVNTGNTLHEVEQFLRKKYHIQNIYTAVLGKAEHTPFKPHIFIFTYHAQCILPYGIVPRYLPSVPKPEASL